jgi:ribonuclease HII
VKNSTRLRRAPPAPEGPLGRCQSCLPRLRPVHPARPIRGLNDSKKLSEAKREALYPRIIERALAHCVVMVGREEIDQVNIFQATMLGMRRAVAGLGLRPQHALIDGNHVPKDLGCPGRAIIGGDALEPAISAASILAKVQRDRWMIDLEAQHPGYGFAQHKGYPTPEHCQALKSLGALPIHRRSFARVREVLGLDPIQTAFF